MWVQQKSNGRIDVTSFPAASLITAGESLESLTENAVNASSLMGAWDVGAMPLHNVVSLPFLFDDRNHFRRTLEGGLYDLLANEYEKKGVKLLNYFFKGTIPLFDAKKFLVTPEDFKGHNLRGLSGYATMTLTELGANAISLPTEDISAALERGVVDGIMTSCLGHLSRGWADTTKYVTDIDILQAGEGLGINLEFFNSLSAEDQAVLEAAAKEMEEAEWTLTAEADDVTCPDFWAANHLQVRKLSQEERAALKERSKAVYERAQAEIPQTSEILALVDSARAK
jgi:TRAP-type C4-dicarboxylate transport system substrate-binding protein